ncbi:MAG: tetratricopeptide repeat protein [Caulobacteraceae bacterium]
MRSGRLNLIGFWALLASAAPLAPAMASGMGMGGGGQMPSASPSMPSGPQYNAAEEARKGEAAFEAGKYKDAVRCFEHVTDAAPAAAVGWYLLGMAKAAGGDDKGAVKAYEKSVKLDPDRIDAHRDYAVGLTRLQQTDKAAAQLAALKSRAAACGDTCPQAADLKAAVAAVRQAMTPTPAPPGPAAQLTAPSALMFASAQAGDLAYVRAVSLINERRYGEAIASLDKAEESFGAHPDILTYQGYAWRKLGRLDKAESYYRQALALAPGHRGATEYYGELKVLRGDLAGARAMLASLDAQCAFGCPEAEDLRRWIERGGDPAS